MTQDNIDFGAKNNFRGIEKAARALAKRQDIALADLRLLISDLEKASGALPLK